VVFQIMSSGLSDNTVSGLKVFFYLIFIDTSLQAPIDRFRKLTCEELRLIANCHRWMAALKCQGQEQIGTQKTYGICIVLIKTQFHKTTLFEHYLHANDG
jgi:hypothetical protein